MGQGSCRIRITSLTLSQCKCALELSLGSMHAEHSFALHMQPCCPLTSVIMVRSCALCNQDVMEDSTSRRGCQKGSNAKDKCCIIREQLSRREA